MAQNTKIYIGASAEVLGRFSAEKAGLMRIRVSKELQKYFGEIQKEQVQFFIKDTLSVDFCVAGKKLYDYISPSDIRKTLQEVVNFFFPGMSASLYSADQSFSPKIYYPHAPEDNPAPLKPAGAGYDEPQINREARLKGDRKEKADEYNYEKLAVNFTAVEPKYSFDQVILPESTLRQINEAIGAITVEKKVFDEWGLRPIFPSVTSAMSFYGPPGTGKTTAAEAIAQKMGKKILRATYADIESKYHGEGPKMVKAIFKSAERDDAVLFINEADSLLSKRLTNVTEGSAQAINSMRSQLLTCLDQCNEIVIFATNLVVNYDKAFVSRLINIEFTVPDKESRKKIWLIHLRGEGIHVPLADDVDFDELAEKDEFCGREIKNAVKKACVSAVMEGGDTVSQSDLLSACEAVKTEAEKVIQAGDHTVAKKVVTGQQGQALKEAIEAQLKEGDVPKVKLNQAE